MIDELEAVLDSLADADPAVLADNETIERLHRAQARLDAITARATGVWDAQRDWALDGARTAATWLSATCHLPKATSHRRVRIARELRHLPHAERAWLDGEITDHHVAAIASKRNDRTAEALDRDEKLLVDIARDLTYKGFTRALSYWQQCNDDGVEDDAAALHDQRRARLSQTWKGCWDGELFLDPIGGSIVDNELRRIEKELFDADWAEAKEQVGDAVCLADLRRTPAQRRADAVVEMAQRSATAPAGGRRPAPLFTVLVGYETFHGRICELADGTVVTPGSLLPWLDEALVERVVFEGPARVLEVGEQRRLFTGALRRALEVVALECEEPGCDVPAEQCQGDHILPFAAGGPTTQANGTMRCGHHNRLRSRPRAP